MDNVIMYSSVEFYDNNRVVYVYTDENKLTHLKMPVDRIEKDGIILAGHIVLKPKKE